MDKQIIMPTTPDMGLISVLSKPYELLTDEFIQRWLAQLFRDHLIDPEYLFLNEKGQSDLNAMVRAMGNRFHFGSSEEFPKELVSVRVSQYTNQTTGTLMHVVTLPTLSENLLLVGNLILHERVSV